MNHEIQFTIGLCALACDPRIPQSAIGYIAQLQSSACSEAVRTDAIRQLQHYVPEFENNTK